MAMSKSDSIVFILNQLLGLILDITDTVYAGLESKSDSFRMLPTQTTTRFDDGVEAFRDDLYMSAAITDNNIIALFTTILAAFGTMQSCKLELGANGEVTIAGESMNQAGIKNNDVNTPSLALREAAAIISLVQDGVDLTRIVTETVTTAKSIDKGAEARSYKQDLAPEEL